MSYRPLLIACLALLGSCAFFRSVENEPLPPEWLDQFRPGESTALDVTNVLGGPAQVVWLGERSAYLYNHVKTKGTGILLIPFILGNVDTRSDRIWFFFDKENTLTHWGATFAAHHTQYAVPWEDVHEVEDGIEDDADRPGVTPGQIRMGAGPRKK